jgi:hypothetical protein
MANSVSRRNHEGYLDLTAYQALVNIERDALPVPNLEKPKRRKRRRKRRKDKNNGNNQSANRRGQAV